ncbi:MAG: ATP-binding protein [Pyramidobacter sp.]|nr:ATP-binding protein [Pyramidobacter sp.]
MLIDRTSEMKTLETEYARKGASLVVIYGRRRLGKTRLITEFCQNKRAIYFLASEENEKENMRAFQRRIADFSGMTALTTGEFNRWESLFDFIAELGSKDERLIVALDEFQYLGLANKAFPSILMREWDMRLKDKNIMLILCGSLIRMMKSQALDYSSPLYGRRTAQLRLRQIPFAYYHEFAPGLSEDDLVQRYAVTGGVPKYAEMFCGSASLWEQIRTQVLDPGAFLYNEPDFLLGKEVSDIGSYFSLLKTISAGNRKLGSISSSLGIVQTSLTKYLKMLEELDLVEREVPVTEENPSKSKRGLYSIKDNFIQFWFRFVYPYKDLLETDQADYVMKQIQTRFIVNHCSYVYEDICRDRVLREYAADLNLDRIGHWWGAGDVEIDICGYDSMGENMLFGECKYSSQPKGVDVLRALQQKTKAVPWKRDSRKEHYIIFSRSGFSDELRQMADTDSSIILAESQQSKI